MRAKAAPSMEYQSSNAVGFGNSYWPSAFHVVEEYVVEPDRGVKHLNRCNMFLLPIEPPKVDPLLLEGPQNVVKPCIREFSITNVEGHIVILDSARISPHCSGHLRKVFLPWLNATSRVKIECHSQTLFVTPREKSRGIRKKRLVPRVASPTYRLSREIYHSPLHQFVCYLVPVHVDDQYVQWDLVLFKLLHKSLELICRARPPSAPPDPK
mmetsp:Transcript_38772/g.153161  ORF Transcript_38772/g.153161 Transcript_38772/m.153161 type:complete len:211 (-) Transcript_38772:1119-1751(-)